MPRTLTFYCHCGHSELTAAALSRHQLLTDHQLLDLKDDSAAPSCEWVDVIPDEYGMACSEPELGVPTHMEIKCSELATRKQTWRTVQALGSEEETLLLCPEHSAAAQTPDPYGYSELVSDVRVGEEPVTERFISVVTAQPDAVRAYLYSHTSIVERGEARGRSTLLLKTSADSSDVDYLARYQAERLSSGLHGARVHSTEAEAREHLAQL